MLKTRIACAAAAVMLSLPLAVSSANAAPVAPGLSLAAQLNQGSPGDLTQVQYRRYGGYRGGGAAVLGGLAAGAIIGGAIAASRPAPYYYGPGYGGGYYAAPPAVVYEQPAYGYGGGGDDVAYCMQRYRSYDPRSGTYLNNDGNRYPCP